MNYLKHADIIYELPPHAFAQILFKFNDQINQEWNMNSRMFKKTCVNFVEVVTYWYLWQILSIQPLQ